jgi:radical SAM protein with 4Fe4S-binding SPASM domain
MIQMPIPQTSNGRAGSKPLGPRTAPSAEHDEGLLPLLALEIEITNRCNLACQHCYSESGPQNPDSLSRTELLSLIDTIANLGVAHVTISGGEPLIHDAFREVVLRINRYDMAYSVNTNGTLITHELAALFLTTRCQEVNVSLHSIYPEVHDQLVGVKGALSKALDGVQLLIHNNVPVVVNVCVTRGTIAQVVSTIQWCKSAGAKGVRLIRFSPAGRGGPASESLNIDPSRYKELLHEVRNAFSACSQALKVPYSFLIDPSTFEAKRCSAGHILVIDSRGNVYACSALRNPQLCAGSIRSTSIASIWLSSPIMRFFRSLPLRAAEFSGPCGTCVSNGACGGGCRASALFHHGSIWGSDPCCWAGLQTQ